MARWRRWIGIIGAALSFLAGLLWWTRRESEARGEAKGRIKENQARLREAAETGDDVGVLREWRRSREDK